MLQRDWMKLVGGVINFINEVKGCRIMTVGIVFESLHIVGWAGMSDDR